MSVIALRGVSFQYGSSTDPVFTDLSLSIESSWNTGLVGRNGRGKSTLLSLINGDIEAHAGTVERAVKTTLFPMPVRDHTVPTFELIKDQIAPFRKWEGEMEALLQSGTDASLRQYGELVERYERHNGYMIDGMIEKECAALGVDVSMLRRPYCSLSGGEQTRSMIAAVFLKADVFPLLDEPTNHLDMHGREALAEYLSHKEGFIVVSHDRSFIDGCCDHLLVLNRNDTRIFPGNYSAWHAQAALEEETERARNVHLTQEIAALEKAARQRRAWSAVTEKEKTAAPDSGFVSHKAAKLMKRALSTERRMEQRIAEKNMLLNNVESVRLLTIDEADGAPEIVLTVENVGIIINGRTIIEDLSFTVRRGERLALIGGNGSGKTTVLNLLRGSLRASAGAYRIPGHITIAHAYQLPLWAGGMLRVRLREAGIDENRFRTIMGAFNIRGDIFERPLDTFSCGELKKVDLCRSFVTPHHVMVWDEPVNFIDIPSRIQIEDVILRDQPTMLFTEHDRTFVDTIATRVIELPTRA